MMKRRELLKLMTDPAWRRVRPLGVYAPEALPDADGHDYGLETVAGGRCPYCSAVIRWDGSSVVKTEQTLRRLGDCCCGAWRYKVSEQWRSIYEVWEYLPGREIPTSARDDGGGAC